MGCCIGAKHSNWCEDYDIVYIDAEGKEYCIFHAPAECKFTKLYDERTGVEKPDLMDAEQFNGMVFARIQGVIDAGEDEEQDRFSKNDWNPRCNFGATIFPYYIPFSKYSRYYSKYLPPINFVHSSFYDDADFSGSLFSGKTIFANSNFLKDASFFNAKFKKTAYFNGTKFIGNAFCSGINFHRNVFFTSTEFQSTTDFTGTRFQNTADFEIAKFRGKSYFYNTQFDGDAYYIESEFHENVSFSNSQFQEHAYFKNSQFYGNADFKNSQFTVYVNFNYVKAQKQIHFGNSTFKTATFDQMEFDGPTYFTKTTFYDETNSTTFKNTIFHDYVNFENTIFKSGANFHLALFKEWSYFRNTKFNKDTSFSGAISKETILLETVDLTNLKFAETNVESFKFIDCNWGEERFAPIYDEEHQDETNCNDTTLAEIYRRLKKIARESADEEQTSHWHYREKEMSRKSLDCISLTPFWNILTVAIFMIPACALFLKMHHEYFLNFAVGISLLLTAIGIGYNDFKKSQKEMNKVASKLYLNAYKHISGYGEDPIKAGTILFGLFFLPFLIQFIVSLTPWAKEDWLKMAMWYMPLIKIKFANTDLTGLQYFFKGLSVTAITLQAALFGFALRNKLRR